MTKRAGWPASGAGGSSRSWTRTPSRSADQLLDGGMWGIPVTGAMTGHGTPGGSVAAVPAGGLVVVVDLGAGLTVVLVAGAGVGTAGGATATAVDPIGTSSS